MNRQSCTALLFISFLWVARTVAAQEVQIGSIDFYGLDKTSASDVRAALRFAAGDTLVLGAGRPAVLAESERRIESLPTVVRARINLVCCESARALVFVGVREWGRGEMRFLPPPTEDVRLPADVVQAGQDFSRALVSAAQLGAAAEDSSLGHALATDPALRAVQQRFAVFASRDQALLRRVLRDSSIARQRALAAHILGYTATKQEVVDDLVHAMSDASAEVRNSAARSLALFAGMPAAAGRPRLPYQPFIALIESMEWSDRNKAVVALARLSESRDAALFRQLKREPMAALVEMARWKSAGHALPAALLLGRRGGLSEDAISEAWARGDREVIIATAVDELRGPAHDETIPPPR